jgi:hypothetical protein
MRRERAFVSSFGDAQKLGQEAQQEFGYWDGKTFALGTSRHLDLLKMAHITSVVDSPNEKRHLSQPRVSFSLTMWKRVSTHIIRLSDFVQT